MADAMINIRLLTPRQSPSYFVCCGDDTRLSRIIHIIIDKLESHTIMENASRRIRIRRWQPYHAPEPYKVLTDVENASIESPDDFKVACFADRDSQCLHVKRFGE
jgi:hypothetical protein